MPLLTQKLKIQIPLLLLSLVPKVKQIAVERWFRGRVEHHKLTAADCIVVSYGKSGRTWLCVMLSRFYQNKHGLAEGRLLECDNFHLDDHHIPTVFFTHDNYLKGFTKRKNSKIDYYHKKVILLVRDPRDVAVSQFYQWRYRMQPRKMRLNKYPHNQEDVSMYDFVLNKDVGLPKIIEFLNLWASEIGKMDHVLVIRYEDLHSRTEDVLKQILAFMATPGTDEEIKETVAFASYENMKKLEQRRVFSLSGGRMAPGDHANPQSYKVRRAKVGGYRDYFSDEEVEKIDALVNEMLTPIFGYVKKGKAVENTTPA